MPEGPEVRREADRIERALAGASLHAVELDFDHLRPYRKQLLGASVLRVETRGKAMLTRFDNELVLYSHNQLYGRWYVVKRGTVPDTRRRLRVALHAARWSALLYSATDVEILAAESVEAHPFLSKLGPDVLDGALGWRAVADRLTQRRFVNRAVGNLYLDQRFIAGIGNYLRSEILFFAGVAPSSRPADLALRQRNELARQTLKVAARAYESRGVTNLPARVKKLRSEGLTRSAYRHAVFARETKPCYQCRERVRKIMVATRRLYYCPVCQPSMR